MHIYLHLDDIIIPWEHTKRGDFLAQNFIGFYAVTKSLEGLMDFLAFLIRKLLPKTHIY